MGANPSRAHDLTRAARSRQVRDIGGLWDAIKTLYPAPIRRRLQKALGGGLPTYADLLTVHLADALSLEADIQAARAGGHMRQLERLVASKRSALGEARRCIDALGPDLSPNDQQVRLPEGFSLAVVEDLEGEDLVS